MWILVCGSCDLGASGGAVSSDQEAVPALRIQYNFLTQIRKWQDLSSTSLSKSLDKCFLRDPDL